MVAPIFTVDWESWQDALGLNYKDYELLCEPTLYLLRILKERKIRAIFYCLTSTRLKNPSLFKAIVNDGHIIGHHGYTHSHNLYGEGLFRSPYWDTTPMPGLCGGFFLRILPLWFLKSEIKKSGFLFVHPHDIMVEHPKLKNIFLNFKRKVGLKNARHKLERILQEVTFADAKKILEKSKKDIHLLAMDSRPMWRRIWNIWNWMRKNLRSSFFIFSSPWATSKETSNCSSLR